MNRNYKISKFVEEVSCKNYMILYNRIFGGTVLISLQEYLDLQSNKMISNNLYELLKKNNIIVANGLNEDTFLTTLNQKKIKDASSGNLLNCLELSVSEECNYNCVYCKFIRYRDKKSTRLLMKKELSLSVILDFIEITKNIDSPIIYFGTAEPLLNWKVIEYVTKIIRKDHSNLKINLITNGSLMTKGKLVFCKNYNVSVGISLDGKPKTQRSQRKPLKATIDSNQVVFNMLKDSKEIGFTFSCLSCTYNCVGFYKDIEYLIGLCRQYNIPELDIDFDTGSLTEESDINSIANELVKSYIQADRAGLYVFGYWLIPFYNIISNDEMIKSFCGNAIGKSICITSDGGFKLCGYESKNIFNYSKILDHIGSPLILNIYESHLPGNNVNCIGCNLEGVCAGQCMIVDSENTIWSKTCLLYRNSTNNLLKYKHFSERGLQI